MLFILDLQRIAKAKVKSRRGLGRTGQACFLTVKSTATPPGMHCGTHWRAFWPEKARLCPPYKGVFLRIIVKLL